MHYRNGREAKNGDRIVKLDGGKVIAFGVLRDRFRRASQCDAWQ